MRDRRWTDRHRRVILAAVAVAALGMAGCVDPDAGGRPDPPPSAGPTTSAPALAPEPGPGFHELSIEWNGEQREFLLDAPTTYHPAEPIPLVVVLHGAPSDAARIRDQSGMAAFSQQQGVLVAYPQGELRRWRRSPNADPVDDTGFLTALVDQLVAAWNVAPGEVYAAGFSNGATMAYRLAVEAADVFAAVAAVSGNFAFPPESVEPAEPVSLIGFVGLDDQDVVAADSVAVWRERLDCEPDQPTVVDEQQRVTRIAAACPDGSQVIEYRIEGAGHVWPNLESHGLDANQAMWELFSATTR
jgi:polyhydroxybutyrate depolymerase